MRLSLSYWVFFFGLATAWSVYAQSGGPANYRQEYERNLEAANQLLSEIHANSRSCPSKDLALSCGNDKCEPDKNEDESTCAMDCSPTRVRSYNAQSMCKNVQEIFAPETYEEIQGIVKKAADTGKHVRVVATKHTTNDQLCTNGTVISTEKLNHVIGIEQFEGSETVVVEPGVHIGELTEWLHARNRAVGYGMVGYYGITVGGSVATAAHGSSMKHSAILSNSVKSVKIVTADGELREYSEKTSDPETFRALRASLGALGVIVQLRLEIRPQFNLDMRVSFANQKQLLNTRNPADIMRSCDFAQILWFPTSKKIMKMCGRETSKPAEPKAQNVLLDPMLPEFVVKFLRLVLHYGACDAKLNSFLEMVRFSSTQLTPPFKKQTSPGVSLNVHHLIGPSHRLLASHLGVGREALMSRDWEVVVPESKFHAALAAIDHYMKEHKISLPIGGMGIRFIPVEDQSLLSHAVPGQGFKKGKLAVVLEINSYYPIGFPQEKREEYSKQYEDLFKMLIEKFEGRPHWAKNQNSIFAKQKEVGTSKDYITRFRSVMDKMDPNGVFSNDFTREFL